jgi:hypothetical protein
MQRKSDGRTDDQRGREAFRAADLLQSGYQPRESDLEKAPIIDDWCPVLTPSGFLVLIGNVTGHPTLRPGLITTSLIIGMDETAGWARTWGRWYKLGKRFEPDVIMKADAGPDLWDRPYFPDEEPDADSDALWGM